MFENSETPLRYLTINKTIIRCDLVKYYREISGGLEVILTDGERLFFSNVTIDDIVVALR